MSNHIEKIVYINLDKRIDRKDHIEIQLNDYGMSNKAERFSAIEYNAPGKGCVGCSYSHIAVLKRAKAEGWSNVLILEDDFQFLVSKEEMEIELERLFTSQISWDVCMLSYNLHEHVTLSEEGLWQVKYAQTSSAYIICQHYYDTLIELFEQVTPLLDATGIHWVYALDVAWRKLQDRDMWLCFSKRLGKQMDGYSDIAGQYTSYNC